MNFNDLYQDEVFKIQTKCDCEGEGDGQEMFEIKVCLSIKYYLSRHNNWYFVTFFGGE